MSRRIIYTILLIVLCILSENIFANADIYGKVTRVWSTVGSNGYNIFQISVSKIVQFGGSNSCTDEGKIMIGDTVRVFGDLTYSAENAFQIQRHYSLLLTAVTTGKELMLSSAGCNGDYPTFYQLTISSL